MLPRALEQVALVEKVLQRVEQLEEEDRDMKSLQQKMILRNLCISQL